MERRVLDISWGSLWKILTMVVFAISLYLTREVLLTVFIAIVLSSAIHTPVAYLEKKKIPRALSVFVIFIVAVALLAVVLYTLIPVSIIQLQYLVNHFNELKIPLLDQINAPLASAKINQGIGGLIDYFFSGSSDIVGSISAIIGNILFIIVSLVLTFYMAISRDGVERFIKAVFPYNQEDYVVDLYIRTRAKLSKWLTGQMIISLFVGILTFIGLSILGIEYALVLAILAAILELIPYVGPIIVGAITFLVTLPKSLSLALLAVLLFFVIQQIENHALVPFIMSRAVGLDPVMVVIALLAGSQLGGLVGAVLAVPAMIIIQEFIDDWTLRKRKMREMVD